MVVVVDACMSGFIQVLYCLCLQVSPNQGSPSGDCRALSQPDRQHTFRHSFPLTRLAGHPGGLLEA